MFNNLRSHRGVDRNSDNFLVLIYDKILGIYKQKSNNNKKLSRFNVVILCYTVTTEQFQQGVYE